MCLRYGIPLGMLLRAKNSIPQCEFYGHPKMFEKSTGEVEVQMGKY